MIKARSFNGPVSLGCDLHMFLLWYSFFPFFGEKDWRELEWEYYTSPNIGKTEKVFSPVGGSFLNFYHENLVECLEVEIMKVWGRVVLLWPPEASHSVLVLTQLPEIHQGYHFSIFPSLWLRQLLPQINRSWL